MAYIEEEPGYPKNHFAGGQKTAEHVESQLGNAIAQNRKELQELVYQVEKLEIRLRPVLTESYPFPDEPERASPGAARTVVQRSHLKETLVNREITQRAKSVLEHILSNLEV